MDNIPFSYNNSKGELTGYAIYYIYTTFDNVELLEFKSNEELIEADQNGTANISTRYFSQKENINKNYTDISFFYSKYKLTIVAVILYENSNISKDISKAWKINNSQKDFKNKKLEILAYKKYDNLRDFLRKLFNILNDKMYNFDLLINYIYLY